MCIRDSDALAVLVGDEHRPDAKLILQRRTQPHRYTCTHHSQPASQPASQADRQTRHSQTDTDRQTDRQTWVCSCIAAAATHTTLAHA
eukprot:3720242-Rhodomonas_salina.1